MTKARKARLLKLAKKKAQLERAEQRHAMRLSKLKASAEKREHDRSSRAAMLREKAAERELKRQRELLVQAELKERRAIELGQLRACKRRSKHAFGVLRRLQREKDLWDKKVAKEDAKFRGRLQRAKAGDMQKHMRAARNIVMG